MSVYQQLLLAVTLGSIGYAVLYFLALSAWPESAFSVWFGYVFGLTIYHVYGERR